MYCVEYIDKVVVEEFNKKSQFYCHIRRHYANKSVKSVGNIEKCLRRKKAAP